MTEPDTEVTQVVFRKWRDGGILALFPEHIWIIGTEMCASYEHVGQHGGADYRLCISRTTPALPEEYSALKKELESLGYNLKVIKRWSRNAN